ncbi:MAG TPA: HPP family protein [Luteibacter sp.]|uniref:HPP family protein n=1 Tax=Luteibacter sp. TaxID=1886636 RepID=UPI002B5C1938|nr:HPP family protein [Luteibacter sp.]HVI54534.1 HPP family protein [Luteibacter sp.]
MNRRKLRGALGKHLPGSLRTAVGAFVGIASLGAVSATLGPDAGTSPLLIAPLGATAMILFAKPGRPAARPYVVLVGNTAGALTGLLFAQLASTGMLAVALALATAVLVMTLLRAVHPPGAGIALVAALAGTQPWADALRFLLANVLLSSSILVGVALAWDSLALRLSRHFQF